MTPRALRVGVLLRDQLVEEHVFVDPAPITIGQSLRCRLSIPADGLPATHALFARERGRLLLHVLPGMTGRIAQGGAVLELEAGAPAGEAIAIDHDARGRLALGEVTVLFQELPAPRRAPRPQLPASMRSSLAERIDPRLALILGASLCVHLAIGGWAWLSDTEVPSMLSPQVAVEYHPARQDVFEITLPDEPPPAPGEPGPGVASPVSPRQIPRPIVPPPGASPADPAMTEAEARRYALLLTGPETASGLPGDLAPRQPHGDLKQQLDDLRATGRAVEVGRDPRAREDTRLGTTPTGPRLDGPTQLERQTADREQHGRRWDLVPEPPPGPRPRPDHDLTIEAVLEKIRTVYMAGLQRCYEKGLGHESTLSGKIRIAFTVNERGAVVEPEARGLSPEVDACVAGAMAGWRFAIPRDREREPTEATFTLSLVLRAI